MLCHIAEAFGSVNLDRILAAQDPRRENEVGIASGVVCMQMREEHRLDSAGSRSKSCDALHVRCCGTANYAGPEVDQIGRSIHDDPGGGSGTLGIGTRRSRSKHDDLCRRSRPLARSLRSSHPVSIEPDIGGLDDGLPSFSGGFEQSRRLTPVLAIGQSLGKFGIGVSVGG